MDPLFTHVNALFADRHAARAAVEQLAQAGFSREVITVMMSAGTHEREFGVPASDRARPSRRFQGVLSAIVAGVFALALPSGVTLRAAGPLASRLVRAVKRSAAALPAALTALGLEASEATFLDEGVRGGSIVVGVQANLERAHLASQLLELSGGASSLRAAWLPPRTRPLDWIMKERGGR